MVVPHNPELDTFKFDPQKIFDQTKKVEQANFQVRFAEIQVEQEKHEDGRGLFEGHYSGRLRNGEDALGPESCPRGLQEQSIVRMKLAPIYSSALGDSEESHGNSTAAGSAGSESECAGHGTR